MYSARNQILKDYGIFIKRWLVFLNIFFMFLSIQVYVNHNAIIENTQLLEYQTQRVKDEISYFNAFQLKYLNSAHAPKLLAHENAVLNANESIINFSIQVAEDKEKASFQASNAPATPWQEWKNFFAERLETE